MPEPVQPGLWEAHVLTSFKAEGEQGASMAPYLPKPQEATYKVCIDESRARAPMGQPSAKGQVKSDARGYSLRETVPSPQGDMQVESSYRRLDARSFEGRNVVGGSAGQAAGSMTMSMQYSVRWLSADCGGLKPSGPSKFGTP